MYVLTVANLKGGAGKTAIVTNLAIAFAETGRRVLFIDCDYQGDSTAAMDVELSPDDATIAQLLERKATVYDGVISVGPNLDLIPAAQDLEPVEERLTPKGCNDALLGILEDAAAQGWDMAVLETRPDRKGMARAATAHADLVIVPVNVQDGNSVKRAGDLVEIIRQQTDRETDAPIRILFNRASAVRKDGKLRNVEKAIRKAGLDQWHDLILPAAMPESAAFHAATVGAQPLMYARPDSVPASAFRAIVAETLPLLTDQES